jgi:putative membrane protein
MTNEPEPVDADSRARTHLANERTYLAWFRTSLTLIALGLAAAQFLDLEATGGIPLVEVLASILVLTGLLVVAIGARRYLAGRERIDAAEFRPANQSVLVMTTAAVVVGLLSVGFLWLLRPAP